MPTIKASTSVAASSVNDNVIAGSQWEFLPYDAQLNFGMNGDANGADLRIDVYSGTDVLQEGAPANVQNRLPVWPDDYDLDDVAAAGERIKIRVRNTSAAGARVLFWAVRITPL